MTFTVWYSSRSFAEYLVYNTALAARRSQGLVAMRQLAPSDASDPRSFHTMPNHIRKILYLDCPDIIIDFNDRPILSLEVSTEAGTGHNVFQRFGRLAAAVEVGCPAFYIFPEAKWVRRAQAPARWDVMNALIFLVLERIMQLHAHAGLLYFFPSDYPNGVVATGADGLLRDGSQGFADQPDSSAPQMQDMFAAINDLVRGVYARGPAYAGQAFLVSRPVTRQRTRMQAAWAAKGSPMTGSPMTSTTRVPTTDLLQLLGRYAGKGYAFSPFLASRRETLIYHPDANFRGDPYAGSLAALDYLLCRTGTTYEDRDMNLALAWGGLDLSPLGIRQTKQQTIEDVVGQMRALYANTNKVLLNRRFSTLSGHQIPRYFMQMRHGTSFTKTKELRMYAYFCDAMLFPDGVLWREG